MGRTWTKFLTAGVASSTFVAVCWASGCSGGDDQAAPPDGSASDARPERTPLDTGVDEPAESTCPGNAPTAADLDGNGGWKAPGALQLGSCSANDLATFKSNFQTAKTWKDLVAGLPTGCQTCLYSHEDDANWRVIVADATDQAGFVNFGACYAAAPGGAEACGKAVQYDEFCITISCNQCPDADYQGCTSSKVTQSACNTNFRSMISSGCGTDSTVLSALDAACNSADKAGNILCGTGSADAGVVDAADDADDGG